MLKFRKTRSGKALAAAWADPERKGIATNVLVRLQALDATLNLRDLPLAWRAHKLKQHKPVRWSISVSGQWRITFEWEGGDAVQVDLEQPH